MSNEKSEIQRVLEDNGYDTRSYSGRGMFGKSCLGCVVEKSTNLLEVGAALGEEGVTIPHNTKMDSMGLGTIVYWPGVAYAEEEEDGEYADDDDDSPF